MTTLVLGATGATGQLLVKQLLDRGQPVRALVRSGKRLPATFLNASNLDIIESSILDLSIAEIAQHIEGCSAVASCLGHSMSFKGIFGQPRRLVTEATQRVCQAIELKAADSPTKVVLMNTAGNTNRNLSESISFAQRCVIALIRLLIPPHSDNEQAADYLRTQVGQNDRTKEGVTKGAIEWVAVRPDDLIDAEQVTSYDLHVSPTRSAIFDAGSTSRINVGHFMAELITDEALWNNWKGQMPVIYNRA